MKISQRLQVFTLCAVAVVVGLSMMRDPPDTAVIEADAYTDSQVAQLLASKHRSDSSLAGQKVLSADAERHAERAERASQQIRQLAAATTVTPDTQSTGDTTAMVRLARFDRPGISWRVPKFIVDDHYTIIAAATKLDSAWRAERMARLFADSVTIPDLRRQLFDADNVITAQRVAIDVRDKATHPRCGRRCGIVIGVLATVATAVVVEKVGGLAR